MSTHATKLAAFTAAVDLAAALGIENINDVTRIEFTPSEVSVTEKLEAGDRRTTVYDITLPVGERRPIVAARQLRGRHA